MSESNGTTVSQRWHGQPRAGGSTAVWTPAGVPAASTSDAPAVATAWAGTTATGWTGCGVETGSSTASNRVKHSVHHAAPSATAARQLGQGAVTTGVYS